MSTKLVIAGKEILPGQTTKLDLFVAKLYDYTNISISVKVIRGKEAGPTLFLSAAMHGDEINGIEIVKRVLRHKSLSSLKGTLIVVPIVNVFGFNNGSRYLPDRRDLNRSFPGGKSGSLASQMADLFFTEIVKKSTHGIDLHSGSLHRANLPQIRTNTENKETLELARIFGAPVVLNSSLRDGSLRQAGSDEKIPILLYEGGEALRISEYAARLGQRGVISVMRAIGMLPKVKLSPLRRKTFLAKSSHWIRAPHSGTMTPMKQLGSMVKEGDLLGAVSDPFGEDIVKVFAKKCGVIIGKNNLPLVNRGDALFHVATLEQEVVEDEFTNQISDDLDYELMT